MLLCAEVVNTHGIRGEVRALCHADGIDFFDKLDTLYLADKRPLKLLGVRQQKGALIMRFGGVDTVEAAEALRGAQLFVPREAVPLPEGRYYIADILGLTVITDEGRTLGRVVDVFKTGSNDVYTVEGEDGTFLIPVIDEVVLQTDLQKGEILMHPLKGLLDDED